MKAGDLVEYISSYVPITHPEMTRFFITLQEWVSFVIESLFRMQGGEILIPKSPSYKILAYLNDNEKQNFKEKEFVHNKP